MNNLRELVLTGHQSFAENIKILLYQHDNNIFTKLNFEDDQIYTDPLFFAIFNNNEEKYFTKEDIKYLLSALVFGYSQNLNFKKKGCLIKSDKDGRIYIPTKGWIATNKSEELFKVTEVDKKIAISLNEENCHFDFIPITQLKGTQIELLSYPHELLRQFFLKEAYNNIDFTNKSKIHQENLEKALAIIKKYCPEHFGLINTVIDKLVVFDISPDFTNSFMSRSAYGTAFFNAYQEDYDEVFLLDDIAHQTGHVIFEALIYEREKYFNGDHLEIIDTNEYEDRTIEVYFHALFTYHLILNCLNACLEHNLFKGKKLHEIKGRMLHCLAKCYLDLTKINADKAAYYFTNEGLKIYNIIYQIFEEVNKKWSHLFEKYTLEGQPYNFTYSIFLEKNPIQEKANTFMQR